MIRRASPRRKPTGPALELAAEILSQAHPRWAECCRRGDLSSLPPVELDQLLLYLTSVHHNLSLFIPARDPRYGISERGGDAVLAYLTNSAGDGIYLMFADVSGFTALLTFLTDRFGKEEAGDIMNLGILNRFCLNKMGLILEHFRDEQDDGDRASAAFKVMLSIRATMPLITREVRRELSQKLAGKPHQDEITVFIDKLVVKASGGMVFDRVVNSEFYGSLVRARITWGNTGKLVAQAEKLGGNDDPVAGDVEEVKGIGVDRRMYSRLDRFFSSGWLGLVPGDLAIGEPEGIFRKVVIRPSGMEKLEEFVGGLCSGYREKEFALPEEMLALDVERKRTEIQSLAGRILEIEKFIGNRPLLLHITHRLGSQGRNNILLDESCSAVRDSGVLFCNFELQDPAVLDELVDEVHLVMRRYGIHYKYNIFPKGDFNLMGVLGTLFSEKLGVDRYYAEVLWHAWRDLNRTLERAFGGRVKLRAGMSVGKALQGPAGDNIVNNEETLIGPDCNLAARLVNEALEMDAEHRFVYPPGTLFTIDSQRHKVEHLLQPAAAVKTASLKGFRKPVELYSLVERQVVETVVEFIGRLRKVPLVTEEGHVVLSVSQLRRSRHLARCLDVIEAVTSGERQRPQLVAFIAGSGVGKTRRIAEMAHWAASRGWPVFFGECYSWYGSESPQTGARPAEEAEQGESHSDEGAYPFYPFIRVLKEQVFRIDNQNPIELKRRKIAEVLAALNPSDPELPEQAPVLASFIGVEVPETDFSAALDAEERRNIFYERTAEIFLKAVESQGKGGVVMLCIDDLQWADRNSLHLLSYVLRRAGRGLVVLVNARKPSQLGILRDESLPVDRTVLKPGLLKTAAVEKLARLVLGLDPDDRQAKLPEEMTQKIVGELERNPFFVIEFCSKLLEQEILTVADGVCTRFDQENFRNVSIPTRIQGVIEDRISRLPKAEHAAIQFSSVLGNILRYIIIRRFLPAVDRDNLFAGGNLDEIFSHLTGQEITRLENEKDPDWVYTFKRALIGEKLYQELVPSLRKRLHGEVAKVFESTELANRFERALLTALHYNNAEVPDKSCAFYLEAGRLAREVFDNERSLMLFEKIEKILKEYRVEDTDNKRMVLLEERGQVNLLLARYEKALADFQALAELARRHAKSTLVARAFHLTGHAYFQRAGEGDFDRAIEQFEAAGKLTRDPLLRAEIFNDRARTHLEKGDRDRALELLDRAERTFERATRGRLGVQERIFRASLLRNRGSVFHRQGEFGRAIEIYNQALDLTADESEPRYRKIRAMLLNSIGLSHMKAFRLEESLSYFRRALDLARSVGDARTEMHVRNNLGVVANDLGNNREALQTLTEQHDALEMLVGETRELASLKFNIGESHMFLENYEAAEPWYRQALAIGEKVGYKEFVVGTRYNLAELLHKLGRTGDALQVLGPALLMAREGGWRLQEMDIANLQGEIHRDLGDYAGARACHTLALELARRLDDAFGASWALRNLAVALQSDPATGSAEQQGCRALLEESLALARRAGQPENLMYSLRELIEWHLAEGRNGIGPVRPLIGELRKLAGKVESVTFQDYCRKVALRLKAK